MTTGTAVSPHWIENPTEFNSSPETKGVTDLPVWSVKTFTTTTDDSRPDSSNEELERHLSADELEKHSSSQPPSRFIDAGPNAKTSSKSFSGKAGGRNQVIPKRVAPPPPKNKKGKKTRDGREPSVEYAVPVMSQPRWFSWRRKSNASSKSNYKELNVKQMQPPNAYSTPGQ